MKMPKSPFKLFSILSLLICTSAHLIVPEWAYSGSPSGQKEDDYDRLDGTGRSGKKVHVIEWEGNLEIHVYPQGSLKSLALKIDDKNSQKKVMVIGYRFKDQPQQQLIRRAILGIPLKAGFHAYRDTQEHEFDKVIISQHGLGAPLLALALEPEPQQLYPEGHPALAQSDKSTEATRKPASEKKREPRHTVDPDSGTIQPFFTESHTGE
jgi:hypothetical protein